jgi:hypothetical protein
VTAKSIEGLRGRFSEKVTSMSWSSLFEDGFLDDDIFEDDFLEDDPLRWDDCLDFLGIGLVGDQSVNRSETFLR